MKCEICGGKSTYDFSKVFNEFGLTVVEYWRCQDCGFVYSKTHLDMSTEAWTEMNRLVHSTYQGQDDNSADPRWKERLQAQATQLGRLAEANLINPTARWLDFGCGDGKLSKLLQAPQGLNLHNYDRYMPGEGYIGDEQLIDGSFDFVLTTSVFEHLRRREEWDRIEALVSPAGALGLHTLVTEQVPSDPNWFYLQAPHCAFFSNTAMALLFKDWGYRSCIYDVDARIWIFFRDDPKIIAEKVHLYNLKNAEPLIFSESFVGYWTQDPRLPAPIRA
jgi:hypothetical protein